MKIGILSPETLNKISSKNEIGLKKGDVFAAKVLSGNKGEILLDIKGLKISVLGGENLPIGEEVNFFLEDINENNIYIKVMKYGEEVNGKNDIILKENLYGIMSKEKIDLKTEEIDEIIRQYKELTNEKEKNDMDLLKTLVFLKKNGLEFNEKIYKNIQAYYKKDSEKNIKFGEDLEENIKKNMGKKEEDLQHYDKGMLLVNAANKKEKNNIIEFALFFQELDKAVDIKIKKDNSENNKDNSDREVFFNMGIELEKFGNIEIKVNKYKKIVNILFLAEKNYQDLENTKKILEDKIKKIGYEIGSFGVKEKKIKREEKGVNIKI